MPDFAVRLAGISHHYGAVAALRDVSLTLPAGGAVALVGPDGVGKSSLLGLISGVKKLQTGQLQVLGHDLAGKQGRNEFLARVAYMPQGLGRNLYPTLSVTENIDFFGRLFGLSAAERAARIHRLLEATGLAPFPDRPAGKLSGGMKQKLSLCCSLVHEPDLLILDEPTTGVDPLSRRQFWDLVDSMRAERPSMTVLVSTAYMEEAERFEHLVAMDDGRIIADGTTADILASAGADTLEDAYIRLLPPERRPPPERLKIAPWVDDGGEPAMEAHDLVRRFGEFVAVDHVSFRIGRGEIFGFLGSNGCGKTTTMKMLTGLLDISSGTALLFGKQVTPGDMKTRMRVGYMSQAFSLYSELSVRDNLMLHARLYRVPARDAPALVEQALTEFSLTPQADSMPDDLPLGIRQRLQLAAACLHKPEILILDEPTSGVDPAARDMFWRHLVRLSREEKVTIFVSTHFMNEAERCDRISLMHRGRVLAMDAPAAIVKAQGAASLEDAFIKVLEAETDSDTAPPAAAPAMADSAARPLSGGIGNWLGHTWAFARREATELMRDRTRIAFALLGPVLLLSVCALAISFDVQHLRTGILDHDGTAASRDLVRAFEGTATFDIRPPLDTADAGFEGLRDGSLQLLIDIPPGFGRDLSAGRHPEVGLFIDGSSPFPASSARAYAQGILQAHALAIAANANTGAGAATAMPVNADPRFIYNQEFRSIYAIVPGLLMLILILIPSMLTALGIVREKEIGSITNLYASPAAVGAFLLGKQAPYVAVAMLSFLILLLLTTLVLGVPITGSPLALLLGGLLFVLASTGLGLLISTAVNSQVAAIFATALISLIPSINFSGFLYPVSTLEGPSHLIGLGFPSSWFQIISLGTITKGLGVESFLKPYLVLAGFGFGYFMVARLLLRKQET
ncbi:ATP-binding cassette domain-containing protein [Sandaracinobacter neustonicus]|uniref:ATP-binding cassette domain-containing protein n=2 Tax=Sandaracinobacter neustonicus TaxID=1715348 RepID=A0A501XNX1_9SPHN|nr:ATP-binding cassette domain-containing protein [Sandaracinobacter neustonicus]